MPARYDWDRMSWKQVAKAQQHYFGQITHIDHQIGRLIAALRWRGLWDDTLVLFTSDHGDMMGDYGLFFKGHFFEGSRPDSNDPAAAEVVGRNGPCAAVHAAGVVGGRFADVGFGGGCGSG